MKELAAEILEAYHVKPEFGEGRGGKRLPGLGSVNLKEGERKLRLLGTSLRKKLAAFFRKIVESIDRETDKRLGVKIGK